MSETREFLKGTSHMFSLNGLFVEELYNEHLKNPDSVSEEWRKFFTNFKDTKETIFRNPSWSPHENKIVHYTNGSAAKEKVASVKEEVSAAPANFEHIIDIYRNKGHFLAAIDPLEMEVLPSEEEALNLNSINIDEATKAKIDQIKEAYCKSIAYEFQHIDNLEQRKWLQDRIENFAFEKEFSTQDKKDAVNNLLRTESFEQFLQSRFPSTKRFSIEGGENAITATREVIRSAAENGVTEIVFGMPHRGRLSMLTKVLNKPYPSMLSEFQGKLAHPEDLDVSGDVKYHLGMSHDLELSSGKKVHLSLTANPSHLEAVNPVVMGKVRAKQELLNDKNREKAMAILLHGDAAFAGQGVVMESLMLSDVPGYTIGGVVHIIVNNQIGFTANASDAHAGRYSTEIAKIIKAPIFHVNGNDAEAILKASRIATEFKMKFKQDVVIDVICYRLYGHNEIDEPRFTQPLMYKKIEAMETPGKIYADKLVAAKIIPESYYEEFRTNFKGDLDKELEAAKTFKQEKADWFEGTWSGFRRYSKSHAHDEKTTGISEKMLKELGSKLTKTPKEFNPHKTIAKNLELRKEAIEAGKSIDWATGEALAFASLLLEGIKVRLSGQDCGRGTFSHRHSVLADQQNGNEYIPLNNLSESQAKFEVIDSLLSEYGVLGFEYGYSTAGPNTLTLWEGQFGDFANTAQVIVDQFISSAEEKWLRISGLVMLLPHGYEGQGPEHSSARLERYLQLCARDNMQVVNCTTPANYFHALRRQIHRDYRKPLIVMTPKSLLRHKLAISELKEFATGTKFQPVLPDATAHAEKVKKIIMCSGKIYYDLLDTKEAAGKKDIALIRVEQYYPFPEEELLKELKKYKHAAQIIWCQEEPKNMGAWSFMKPRLKEMLEALKMSDKLEYVGRTESASTAAGYLKVHNVEQAALIKEAIE